MNKHIKLKPELWARIEKYLDVKGWTFAEFIRRVFNEFLTKEGF